MSAFIRILPLFPFLFRAPTGLQAQSSEALYLIHNPDPGEFSFARFDLPTGNVTDLESVPISGISSAASSCIDAVGERYLFCTGTTIISFDPDGVAAPVSTSLPLPAGANFFSIEYDPCDGVVLGILNHPPVEIALARFDPALGEFENIMALPTTTFFCAGCQAMFDPATRIYMLRYAGGFLGIDVDNGTTVYDTQIEELPDFTPMHHLAYDCEQELILGTSVGLGAKGETGKFLLELDPVSGDVTVLSGTPTQSGLMKPMIGGSCIDLGTGMFYWSGAGGVIVGAAGDGDMIYDQTGSSAELFLIEHFSACNCSGANGISDPNTGPSLRLFPNPAQDRIQLQGTIAGRTFVIEDGTGRIARMGTSTAGNTDIGLAGCAPGIYSLRTDEQQAIRFVIQP